MIHTFISCKSCQNAKFKLQNVANLSPNKEEQKKGCSNIVWCRNLHLRFWDYLLAYTKQDPSCCQQEVHLEHRTGSRPCSNKPSSWHPKMRWSAQDMLYQRYKCRNLWHTYVLYMFQGGHWIIFTPVGGNPFHAKLPTTSHAFPCLQSNLQSA
jgi:hypothetical protein